MAASMPAWVARTLDFLTHPLGSANVSSVGQSERPQRALLAGYQSPTRREEKLEKRRARSRKTRFQARGPRFPVSVSNTSEHKKSQASGLPLAYEDRSTQTDDVPNLNVHRSRSIDRKTIPISPASRTSTNTTGQEPRDGFSDEQMDIEVSNIWDSPGEQDTVLEDHNMSGGPAYTDGAPRVINARDGVKDCLALLLTSELVAEINQISTRSKKFESLTISLKKAKRELRSDENMLEYGYDSLQDIDGQAQLERVNEEIVEIQERIADARKRVETLEDEVATLTINLAHSRYRCEELLEGALGNVDLLDIPAPELAMQMDHTGGAEQRSIDAAAGEAHTRRGESSDRDEATIQRELTETIRRAAKADFETKREILVTMDEAFEHRQEDLAEEKAEYHRCVREGICHITQTEFDLLALEDFRKMTANLREAHEAFEESFKHAKQLGALDEGDAHYQESVFSDWSGGYALSMEKAMVGSAPTKNIACWQAGVEQSLEYQSWRNPGPEACTNSDPKLEAQGLEDCDLQSVAISDSWSCVDWSRNRRRIDRWRAIAGRDR
ncbi:MAG: hypothetical protein LQ348_005596 [Seirophora lacunosa]|nr:MAG: hypothetical protein LQ348_005596 [Seirophora lacunosa]